MPGSGGSEVGCRGLAVLRIALSLEADALALVQGAEARALDCRDMHEDVRRAVFRRDEAETLDRVVPFDGTDGHDWILPQLTKPRCARAHGYSRTWKGSGGRVAENR